MPYQGTLEGAGASQCLVVSPPRPPRAQGLAQCPVWCWELLWVRVQLWQELTLRSQTCPGLSLRPLWSLNFVLPPRPQLAPASQHQARLNPCSLGHFSPPYLKVITKDGGAPCTPQSPAAAPAAPALSSSSAPLNLSILPQARPGPGSPSPHPPLFKALLAWG